MSGRRKGDGLAWIVVGETLLVRSAELEGLICIRGDKDVHGSFGLAFLLFLTVPSVPPPKKPQPSPTLSSFTFLASLYNRWE